VRQIRVTVNNHTEVFSLKRELLSSRAAALAKMAKMRDDARRALKETEETQNRRAENASDPLPFLPAIASVRPAIEGSDVPSPPRDGREQLDGERFMAELIWFDSNPT
jgi:hypothetical protein